MPMINSNSGTSAKANNQSGTKSEKDANASNMLLQKFITSGKYVNIKYAIVAIIITAVAIARIVDSIHITPILYRYIRASQ